MPTEIKFKRKTKIEIDSTPVEDGSLLFSEDTPEIFMDNGEERLKYGVDAYNKEESDGKYATKEEIPEKLPNPNALTFTGAVNDTYDGNEAKTINIPVTTTDTTLTQEGQAADAKIVGDKLNQKTEIKDDEISEVYTWSSKQILNKIKIPKLTKKNKNKKYKI